MTLEEINKRFEEMVRHEANKSQGERYDLGGPKDFRYEYVRLLMTMIELKNLLKLHRGTVDELIKLVERAIDGSNNQDR
jgi:hypothetical protein